MGTLTVKMNGQELAIPFDGAPLVADVLEKGGIAFPHPCGKKGKCGKCALPITGCLSSPTTIEKQTATRLSCQTRLLGNAVATLPEAGQSLAVVQTEGIMPSIPLCPRAEGYGIAMDIGTTTLALRLIDLGSGVFLGELTAENPQRAIAADVIGRIEASLSGRGPQLHSLLLHVIQSLIDSLLKEAGVAKKDLSAMVAAGNTAMLYLLAQRDPISLAKAPFEADCLFGITTPVLGIPTYLPRCVSAFVGADITCALIASGLCGREETSMLIDIGTNGEIALWHNGNLFVGSTAAGPAFEGYGIHFGVGCVNGAVDQVFFDGSRLHTTTIGHAPAVGICGSGLIDAVACFLQNGEIDATGLAGSDRLWITDCLYLTQQDIRNVQLAKGAIAAGIHTLLEEAGIEAEQVAALYIAGGFGNHINLHSAACIGLIPAPLFSRAKALGNGALAGSSMMLLNQDLQESATRLALRAKPVNFGGNNRFAELYMREMMFQIS